MPSEVIALAEKSHGSLPDRDDHVALALSVRTAFGGIHSAYEDGIDLPVRAWARRTEGGCIDNHDRQGREGSREDR